MLNDTIIRAPQVKGIFSENCVPSRPEEETPCEPIRGYGRYVNPIRFPEAVERGRICAKEVLENKIADFEKDALYCEKTGEDHPDRMVHVSTFKIIDGVIYMTYYANTGTDAEDPTKQEARLAFCPENDPEDKTIVTILKVGDVLDGLTVDRVYDTIMLYKGGGVLYLLWTASLDGLYYRLWCTYDIRTRTLGSVHPNRFQVGNTVNDFSTSGIKAALADNGIPFKSLWSDIGIMQKLTSREEDGETWYYTGAYSGNFNCIIKSRDLVTWQYVSTPDFPNYSLWENAVYVIGDKCFYCVRQDECMQCFLTCFDLKTGKWAQPVLIRDAQSRSDFFLYEGTLYLVHAPVDRNGFGIVRIDTEDLANSKPVAVAQMESSCFYPYVELYGEYAYISYTVARKHIRLSRFSLKDCLGSARSDR